MARPKKNRVVSCDPNISYFKPRGIPLPELEEVCLTVDECEAIRLADLLDISYEDAGQQMGVSRATFGRIVNHARKVISDALINGKAIKIEGGCYTLISNTRIFICNQCSHKWEEPCVTGKPSHCPSCSHKDLQRISEKKD